MTDENSKLKILLLIRERKEGIDTEHWTDLFYVPASDIDANASLERLRSAVRAYLMTDSGLDNILSTSYDFNWGDAIENLSQADWAKLGVYQISDSYGGDPDGINVPELLKGKHLLPIRTTAVVKQDEVLIEMMHEVALNRREESKFQSAERVFDEMDQLEGLGGPDPIAYIVAMAGIESEANERKLVAAKNLLQERGINYTSDDDAMRRLQIIVDESPNPSKKNSIKP